MVRTTIARGALLAISLATALTALPVAAEPLDRRTDDSFLYARPANNGQRVPNYVADSARGQPLDYSDRRRIDRPYLSGESAGVKLPTR
ncbi:MAG: hypothetical protein ACOYJQ_09710 [Pseudochelatococcus sp.]|uniref:hypothetical protein n=1 Tax=Pseudochelatococcus sp. TaxID=2020869 RepID=UPI003D8C9A4D